MMRLLKLGVYDAKYLAEFYARRRRLAEEPYLVQHAALIADRAASSDFWTSALAKRGYVTCDIIANAVPLQRRWAAEHGVAFDAATFVFEVSAAQIARFAPDVLLVADYTTFTPAFLRDIRESCSSIRLIVGWCGAPYSDLSVMREWDIALSCIPEMVADFQAQGLTAAHVNHAFDPRVLAQLQALGGGDDVPFSFLGSVMVQQDFHQQREEILLELIDRTPLRIWTAAGTAAARESIGSRARRSLGRMLPAEQGRLDATLSRVPGYRRWTRWARRGAVRPLNPVHSRIVARAEPALYGLEMFQQLRDSKVTLNTHINVSPKSASNMRLFEACGVGTCLLTDWKPNIRNLFEPDMEVVTYASTAEAVEKYRYLAGHPAERRAIAEAGQRRALWDHNFDRRAEVIDHILRQASRGKR